MLPLGYAIADFEDAGASGMTGMLDALKTLLEKCDAAGSSVRDDFQNWTPPK